MTEYEVNSAEIAKLYDDINKMIEERFGLDDSGDPKVQCLLADRTRHLPMHWLPIDYPRQVTDRTDLFLNVRYAHANLGIASEQLRQTITALEMADD